MRKSFVLFLLILILVSPWGALMNPVSIVQANPDMFPANGDAWTENDNATYTWKFHTSYVDTMAWTTSDVHEGTYALNVTHTKASTATYFRVILDQNYDVTAYDGIFFWLKATSPDASFGLKLSANPTDTNWDSTNQLITPLTANLAVWNATWIRVFIPLFLFDAGGTATWGSIRQIYFQISDLGSADNSTFLVDNLYFTTFNVAGQTPATDQLKLMPLAYYNMKLGQYTETVDSIDYTTMYDWQNITDNTFIEGGLEFEVMGHTVYALSLAYEKTHFDFYLTEAERIAPFLLQAQENNGLGKGGFHNYYAGAWMSSMGMVYQGWIMAGLSALYGQTSNTIYKTAVDSLRNFICGIMWNSTNNIFNANFDNNTQAVTYTSSYSGMREGAGTVGLATYYRYVSENATVLDRLNKALNKILKQTTPYIQSMVYESAKWEDNAYQLWGMYESWKATANTTYRDSFLNVSKVLIGTYMKNPSMNGSASRHNGQMYTWGLSGNYLDGWGLHCSLPLMFLAYDIDEQAYFVNASELSLFNHLRLTQTTQGALKRDTSTYADRQYYGTPAFIVLGAQLYHLNKETNVYIPASTGQIKNIALFTDEMIINVTGTATTTTYVYCGNRGEPKVTGASSFDWDEQTRILEFTVAHSSANEVRLKWGGTATTNFVLNVFVTLNGLPTEAIINVEGENRTIFGLEISIFPMELMTSPLIGKMKT